MAQLLGPRAWLRLRRARREADYWIEHGFGSRFPWRVAELTSDRERRAAARALAGVIGEVRGAKMPGATPIRRVALRPHLARLDELERRLRDGEPVTASGMLAVDELLTRGDSCLFAPVESVDDRLRAVLVRLTPEIPPAIADRAEGRSDSVPAPMAAEPPTGTRR
jgi:hypothetical protein